ncbi:MAG: glycosyltransferase family 4 protein [Oscillospiraceae bacterium]|nr:glycosyltransferase family 4 protein [Oscillospiraceae bacterium]
MLTNEGNRKNIESYLEENGNINIHFHYVPVPHVLGKLLKGRKFYFASYVIWQWYAYKEAKKLHIKEHFDIAHHVAIADFLIIGLLWKLDVPFIFGPVGGGQETPYELRDYVQKYRRNERIRSLINNFALSLPSYKKGCRKAAEIFVSNDETVSVMRKHLGFNIKLTQMCELGVDDEYLEDRKELAHENNDIIHILVSGRLMYRKGIELLLDAVKVLETNIPYVVDLYGGGHQIEDVKQQIIDRKLQDIVIMHGKVPFEKMPKVYADADIFCLPSLRETTGTAVIEAMANKLPVVALNQNGVKYLVEEDAGILAEIGTKEETIRNLAAALKTLIESYELRVVLGNNGYEKLRNKYTWKKKTEEMTGIYKSVIQKQGKGN